MQMDNFFFKVVVYGMPISEGRCRVFARFLTKLENGPPKFIFTLLPKWI